MSSPYFRNTVESAVNDEVDTIFSHNLRLVQKGINRKLIYTNKTYFKAAEKHFSNFEVTEGLHLHKMQDMKESLHGEFRQSGDQRGDGEMDTIQY